MLSEVIELNHFFLGDSSRLIVQIEKRDDDSGLHVLEVAMSDGRTLHRFDREQWAQYVNVSVQTQSFVV